ncbi:acetyl-CoA carboxylase biotin carboxyl carrier protein [Micromonospora auratinigra]|uniref:Biotin carboxyl carrier protein of acetyl-CoA carboxylase n=1 Tax=Micromonospora auratinigra TaxID=261654 RepID=A0A1A8ZG95_9ACTN|nr:biotin/lipoyl-containing protein [Micromonospora auratinigra]SBT42859.1 acetyl-CoA carboxylase biotin carboxyl carrier protein [Micromonospora auratinigra]
MTAAPEVSNGARTLRVTGTDSDGASGYAALLDAMTENARRLLAAAPRTPRVLRLSAGQVEVALEWETAPAPAVGAGGVAGEELPAARDTGLQVLSPTVGVFYRSAEPGAKPFVEVGDVITVGQQLAIVEAMKLMVPVESTVHGRIEAVLHADGDPVEYGEPLFVVVGAGSGD